MDIDNLLTKHSNTYRFHGVKGATLAELIEQSVDGTIVLWGTDHDEHVDNADNELDTEYVQGAGYLYTVGMRDIDMSFNEFCDDEGLVLVLEPMVSEPQEYDHSTDRRQCIILAEEWRVIGGIRATTDDEGDIVEQEAFSLSEILSF